MAYAALIFGRAKYFVFELPGEQRRNFDREEARSYFDRGVKEGQIRYSDIHTDGNPRVIRDHSSYFGSWYASLKKEVRTWQAEFVGPDGTSPITLGTEGWAFPVSIALQELNKLERQGWKIVHVSEDHGLYQGVDTADEAYLTRVRYLLHNPGL
jgi:hypothetical protein